MTEESTFGKPAEQLRELFSIGADDLGAEDRDNDPSATPLDLLAERPGQRIDRYRLLRVLGESGMGVVYLAEQEDAIRRRVALKVIKPGMDSSRVIARFEAERQALALLDHPHIAQIYDAGTTPEERPYFVMECVKGLPITEYCDHHRLGIRDRLVLFQKVCCAVQHAHQKGIIHRDLKPSNILISVEQDQAMPKIIDFGVAKAMSQPLTERTLFTEDTQMLGTPEYVSPEQLDMISQDIDTRSDVYSLGVLLYELLTGVLPFDPEELRAGGIEHVRRTIRETDPKPPSTRITKLGSEAQTIAKMRSTQVQTLSKRLRSELEWIPLKAMRKKCSERYRSASELADDVENYLSGDPLTAGPPTAIYRLKKFVRRNAMLCAAVLAVAATLVLGLAGTTYMYLKAEDQHLEAEARLDYMANQRVRLQRTARQAQAMADFLLKDILAADSISEGQELDLNSAIEKLESNFEDHPLVKARLRTTVGQSCQERGRPELASQQLERAYQIRLQQLGPENSATSNTAHLIAWAYREQGSYDDACRLWTKQIEILQRVRKDSGRALLYMCNIGEAYFEQGRYQDAETQLDQVLELCERSNSSRRSYVVRLARLARGSNYLALGRYEDAERALVEVLTDLRQERQPRVARILRCTMALSQAYQATGQCQKAQELCETTLATIRQKPGDERSAALALMSCLGTVLTDLDLFDRAEQLLRESLTGQRQILADDHEDTLTSMQALAVLLTRRDKYEEAETLFTEALHARRQKRGADHPKTFESMHELGVLYLDQSQYDKAESKFLEAYKGRSKRLRPGHPHTGESIESLIQLYEAWGKSEEVEKWREELSRLRS